MSGEKIDGRFDAMDDIDDEDSDSRVDVIDFVLRTVEKRDIRFIRLWFTDVLGNLKSFAISSEDLEQAFVEGVGVDGSSVEGFVPAEESDMLAFPDATTFQLLPWRPSSSGVARIFCDVRTPDREPFSGDPRYILKKVFRRAQAQGYVPNVGPRVEYFHFAADEDGRPQVPPALMDHAGYFDLTATDSSTDLRRETTLMLERMSIPVERTFHSNAPSQSAVELRYAEAVSSADNIMTMRHVISMLAYQAGMAASFMPKPFSAYSGSGMFLYQSLFDTSGNNLFWGEKTDAYELGRYHLSELAARYTAGLLKYAPEFTLLTNPTVNSYKRLVPNGEVPVYTTWGRTNRSALVRVPVHKPGKHRSMRIELRTPDPSANPYLAIAASIAAGLKGIEEGLELQPETVGNAFELSPHELDARGIRHLPRTLGEAIDVFERSELMRETLGEHTFDYLVEQSRNEWEAYCSAVTDWEFKRCYGTS